MNSAQRILVIAPHPDDEILGCGGTLALAAERRAEVHVLVVFDGAAGDPDGKYEARDYVARRAQESRAAGRRLGLEQYSFWNLPEGHLALEHEIEAGAARLARAIANWRPDTILATWSGDAHPDHQNVARAVQCLARKHACACPIWGFEVWSPLDPQQLVDVSSVWTDKLEALALFQTQLAYDDLAARCTSMARGHRPGLHEAFRRFGVSA